MSELKELIAQAGSQMEKTVEHLEEALARVRAGKANVKILDGIMVEYYGSPVPLTQVGTVTVPDAKSIVITPWEKGIIRDIERLLILPLALLPRTMANSSVSASLPSPKIAVASSSSKSRVMPKMPRSASVTLAVTPLMLSRRASRQTILLRT